MVANGEGQVAVDSRGALEQPAGHGMGALHRTTALNHAPMAGRSRPERLPLR
jgi:hypothetical protein